MPKQRYIGGPLDGGLHDHSRGQVVLHQEFGGRLAAYYVESDATVFLGWPASRAEALRMQIRHERIGEER